MATKNKPKAKQPVKPKQPPELKWPKGPKHFMVPLYNQHLWVATTVADFNACRKFLGLTEVTACSGCACRMVNEKTGQLLYLAGVFEPSLATLVHELAHTTFFILDDLGIPVEGGENNEAFCYLLDALYTQVKTKLPNIK
jgi:hypothetical protein